MAAAAKKAAIISSLPVVGGIIFCGVILLFIAIVGLYGAFKQHQIALFAYMVVLFSIFVIQFSVACASLAASTTDELDILGKVSYFYFLKFSAVCAVLVLIGELHCPFFQNFFKPKRINVIRLERKLMSLL